jgi:hypothetical protein
MNFEIFYAFILTANVKTCLMRELNMYRKRIRVRLKFDMVNKRQVY